MDDFAILLNRLPQELIDIIWEEVFTAPVQRVHVGRGYRPPHLLLVNSSSRQQFAKSFYNNTIFIVDHDLDLEVWLDEVEASGHTDLLKELRFLNRSLLDPCVSRLQAPLDRSHLYRRVAAEQHGAHMLARLRRNLSKTYGERRRYRMLRLEQHFINDDGFEDVIVICSRTAESGYQV